MRGSRFGELGARARLVVRHSRPVLSPSPGKAQVKPAAQERGGGPAPLPRHRRVCSDEGGKLSPFLPPEIFQKLQIAEAQSARKYGGAWMGELGHTDWDKGLRQSGGAWGG